MSKLTALHKQIAALQAKAERITKQEMSAAVAKVKALMSDFGVTIEHLTQSVVGKSAPKKSPAGKASKAARKTASVAKYADPKSGKTWSGFGRAPGWIADAKNRDAYLVGTVTADSAPAVAKKKPASKAAKPVKAKAPAVTKVAAKKAAEPKSAAAKKSAAKPAATKKVATAKAAAKKVTRKASAKVAAPAPADAPASAA